MLSEWRGVRLCEPVIEMDLSNYLVNYDLY